MGHETARAACRAETTTGPRHRPTTQTASSAAERLIALQRDAGNSALLIGFDIAQGVVILLDSIVANHAQDLLPDDAWLDLRLALVSAVSDIGTAGILAEAALIQAETDQIAAEVAAMREEMARIIDHRDGHPGDRAFERLMVLAALAGGQTSDVELTDIVFLGRHQERREAPLEPGKTSDAPLIKEWVHVRTSLVRSVMSSALGKAVLVSKGGSAGKRTQSPAQGT